MSLSDIEKILALWKWAISSRKRIILASILTPFALFFVSLLVFVETKERWNFIMDLYFKIVESLGIGYDWVITYQIAICALVCTFLILVVMNVGVLWISKEMVEKAETEAKDKIKQWRNTNDTILKKDREQFNEQIRDFVIICKKIKNTTSDQDLSAEVEKVLKKYGYDT
jgi:hypothetical protein